MMVAVGFEGTTYSNGGNKTGSYSLANNAAALKDNGEYDVDKTTPYFDVVVLSSSKLVSGADAGSQNALNGDIKLSFYIDDTDDYKPELKALDPNNMPSFPYAAPDGVTYQDEMAYNTALLGKFYDDAKAANGINPASYLIKGSDLEIDVTVDEHDEGISTGTPAEFWSLTNAIAYQDYNAHVIKLICEVPVLEALSVSGSGRMVILDVNSFDIQIANNTDKDQAGLTIGNGASLSIKDGTETSGAELAIGNNATMVIKSGGTLIIDESCTNEVEYDAATVLAGETLPDLGIGEITIEDGGTLINRGVVNVEGAESKPKAPNQQEQEQGQTVITDVKRADMFVNHGGLFENYGCLSLKGDLYVLGTLNNYGKYNDVIVAHDPDKGTTSYHRGIQVTWKDVVTDEGIEPGVLNVGINADGSIDSTAELNNYGDIVLCPGTINLRGTFNNTTNPDAAANYAGHLYMCTMNEAIIPIIPTQEAPLVVEKRVPVDPPKESVFNKDNGTVNTDNGFIEPAKVELIHNGVLGKLIPLKDVQDVKEKIAALPESTDVKVSDKEAIEAARAAYDALTEDQKAKIDADKQKELEEKLEAAEKRIADQKAVDAVIEAINALDGKSDETAVKAAREALNALTDDQKAKIGDEMLKNLEEKLLAAEERTKTIPVTEIKLNGISHKIAAGRKIRLTAVVLPTNATNKKLIWTSSNKKLAKVNQEGVVKISKKAKGKKVIIKAMAADGSKCYRIWKIKVMKGVVKKVKIKAPKKRLKVNQVMKLKAIVKATKGANKKVKWICSNNKYMKINAKTGKVKALPAGKGKKVKITAKATDGSNKKKSVIIKIE